MFTSQLPNEEFRVIFSEYSQRHFIKKFEKLYPGKRWTVTQQSIFDSLRRLYGISSLQQVDELKAGDDCILFKYDFAVAQTNVSPKASGNRCVCVLDLKDKLITVLMIYSKTDLPKNKKETDFIKEVAQQEFKGYWERLSI